MKQLSSYILESNLNEKTNLIKNPLFESYTYNDVINIVVENLTSESIDEGLSSFVKNVGDKIIKLSDKIGNVENEVNKEISELSKSSKKIIDDIKTNTGKQWNKIKGPIVKIVNSIDTALKPVDSKLEDICKIVKVNYEEVKGSFTAIITNTLIKGDDAAKEVQNYIDNEPNKFLSIGILILGAKIALKSGVEASTALDILINAGFK